MSSNTVFISIVVPVYNEERRITAFLQSVIDYLLEKDFSYELVIVDDGSRDRTIAVIESLLNANLPGIFRIVKLPVNKGKGAAIREGMLHAKGDYIFFLDADGSTSIREIDSFIPKFSPGIDIYIATRTIKHKAPQKRKFFGYGYIFLANLLLGLRVVDITCRAGGMNRALVTHELGFAATLATEILFMENGLIVEQGPPATILNNAALDRTREFCANIARLHTGGRERA